MRILAEFSDSIVDRISSSYFQIRVWSIISPLNPHNISCIVGKRAWLLHIFLKYMHITMFSCDWRCCVAVGSGASRTCDIFAMYRCRHWSTGWIKIVYNCSNGFDIEIFFIFSNVLTCRGCFAFFNIQTLK